MDNPISTAIIHMLDLGIVYSLSQIPWRSQYVTGSSQPKKFAGCCQSIMWKAITDHDRNEAIFHRLHRVTSKVFISSAQHLDRHWKQFTIRLKANKLAILVVIAHDMRLRLALWRAQHLFSSAHSWCAVALALNCTTLNYARKKLKYDSLVPIDCCLLFASHLR